MRRIPSGPSRELIPGTMFLKKGESIIILLLYKDTSVIVLRPWLEPWYCLQLREGKCFLAMEVISSYESSSMWVEIKKQ